MGPNVIGKLVFVTPTSRFCYTPPSFHYMVSITYHIWFPLHLIVSVSVTPTSSFCYTPPDFHYMVSITYHIWFPLHLVVSVSVTPTSSFCYTPPDSHYMVSITNHIWFPLHFIVSVTPLPPPVSSRPWIRHLMSDKGGMVGVGIQVHNDGGLT